MFLEASSRAKKGISSIVGLCVNLLRTCIVFTLAFFLGILFHLFVGGNMSVGVVVERSSLCLQLAVQRRGPCLPVDVPVDTTNL